MQEFTQDFAPPSAVRTATAPAMTRAVSRTAPQVTQATVAATGTTGTNISIPHPAPIIATQHIGKAYEMRDQKDRETVGMVEAVGGMAMLPLMLDMGTALLSKVLTLNGLLDNTKWGSRVNGTLRPLFRAARTTEGRDIGNFFNRVDLKRAEFNARSGLRNKGLEDRVARNADKLLQRPEIRTSAFGDWIERNLGKLIQLKPFEWLDGKFRKFAQWREKRLFNAGSEAVKGLEESLRNSPGATEPGWIGKNIFKQTSKELNVAYDRLNFSELGEHLSARNAAGAEAATHALIDQKRMLAAATEGAHNQADIFKRVAHPLRSGATSFTGAAGWNAIAESEGSAIAKALRMLPKNIGRASVLHLAFGVGSAFMVAAKFMDGGRENRLEGHLIKDFAADIYGVTPDQVTKDMLTGAQANPLVKEMAHTVVKAKKGRGAHSTLNAGFEVANVATLKGLGAGGMLLMPWYGAGPGMPGLEQLSKNMLVGDNSPLVAYQQLRDAEAGKVELPTEERVARVKCLIASVPGIARHHGIDNRLVAPMAEALVAQNLSTRETLQTIATPDKMVALAKSVEAEAKAKEATAETTHAAPVLKGSDMPKPPTKVSMAEAEHQGTVHVHQKAQGH